MPFEDLLRPKAPPCRTCAFIETLKPGLAAEIDAAMAKAKYGDATLARGLAAVAPKDARVPSAEAVKNHRTKEHRKP